MKNKKFVKVLRFSIQESSFYSKTFLKTREKKATRPFTNCKLWIYSGLEKVSDYQHLAYNDCFSKVHVAELIAIKLNMPYAPKRSFVSYKIAWKDKGIKRMKIKLEISLSLQTK